jgi:hypothetical protein
MEKKADWSTEYQKENQKTGPQDTLGNKWSSQQELARKTTTAEQPRTP